MNLETSHIPVLLNEAVDSVMLSISSVVPQTLP